MTFATRGTDIAMCHNTNLTCGNKKILQKKVKKIKKTKE